MSNNKTLLGHQGNSKRAMTIDVYEREGYEDYHTQRIAFRVIRKRTGPEIECKNPKSIFVLFSNENN